MIGWQRLYSLACKRTHLNFLSGGSAAETPHYTRHRSQCDATTAYMMAHDQSSIRLIRAADFDAKSTCLMIAYLRELKQARVFGKVQVHTSSSKGDLITE